MTQYAALLKTLRAVMATAHSSLFEEVSTVCELLEILRITLTISPDPRLVPAQIANKFGGGVDKLPLEQRYLWAKDNVTQIFEAAENPVHGTRWWMEVRWRP